MTDEQRFSELIQKKQIVLHSVDYECRRCFRSFDFVKVGKVKPLTVALAHAKSCALARP